MKKPLAHLLRRLVGAPTDDPVQLRRAQLLGILVLGTSASIAVLLPVRATQLLLSKPFNLELRYLLGSLVSLAILLTILRLNQLGHTKFASYLFLVFATLGIAVFSISEDPDRVNRFYLIPTVLASFLTNPVDSFLFAALSSTADAMIYIARPDSAAFDYLALINVFFGALVAWQVATQLNAALRKIQQHARELDRKVAEQTEYLRDALDNEYTETSKLQAVLQSMSEGVIVFDQNRKAIMYNPGACDMLGCRPEDMASNDLDQILRVASSPEEQSLLGLIIGQGERWNAQLKVAWGTRTLAFSLAPVKLPSNQQGTVIVLRDITKEAEVDQIKSEFMSLVSRELSGPMTAVKGYVDLLATGAAGVLTDTQYDFVQIVRTNASRLNAMVESLNELARIEAGDIKMTLEAVSLRYIAHKAVRDMRLSFVNPEVQLALDIPDDLPEVLADPARLEQIIRILLSNAIKYTFEGTIGVAAFVAEDYVQVDISDTGIGIPEQEQARLFTSFFRASNVRALKIPGSGLGLALIRSLVELHGGHICIQSAVGRGSVVSFTIPVFPRPLVQVQPDARPVEVEQGHAKMPKVLVISSDPQAARSMCEQLEWAGYTTCITTELGEVLELAEQEQPGLVLLDDVSGMQGADVLKQLGQHSVTRAIPILVTSSIPEMDPGLLEAGADVLIEPISKDQLLSSVRRVLSQEQNTLTWSVLVAEAEPDARRWLAELLLSQGFAVLESSDYDQTLAAIAERRPDLILFGLKLTTKDGWTVLRRLKQNPDTAGVPIILLTAGRVDLHFKEESLLSLGIKQILTKPVPAGVLIHEIRRLLLT
jgi:PAS domain S-box-containing protein